MIKGYIVESFHHPENGHVLLVKLTAGPSLTQSIARAWARGDWGETEFVVTDWRWPDKPNASWDIAIATNSELNWVRCEGLWLVFG